MFGVREKLLSRWVKVLSSRLKVERTPDDGRAGLVLPVLNVGRGLCQMQSAKVLIMPKPTPDHAARLRSYENPPYSQFSIDVLREVTKAFSDEISPIREDIGGLKYGVNLMQSELKSYGQRLRTIEEDVSTIRARVTTSMKTAGWIVAGIVTLIAIAANLLQLYQYFHPHS